MPQANKNWADKVFAFRIRAGTTIIRGRVASQLGNDGFGSYAEGGGQQIYVPNFDDAELIGQIR